MSDWDSPRPSHQKRSKDNHVWEACEGSDGEGQRLKRREKNRVAAQRSRKKQAQRADVLHEACELLEARNRKLRREVDSLSAEQHLLTEALRAHEPLCPTVPCLRASSASRSPQPDDTAACSV
ncbi:basic leucine zipper transcriptional factor ATF-like 3 [Xiphias gladius]|uniref:basic leucine zipper transcriptional factor ATF-like 3 n=1 Tax=Xiphias gladius TaxID=8245 RepID=UPI001A998DDB|nr:basic leucine zipper transcriptional factor ATF-like 3 [Xiphias gladius]